MSLLDLISEGHRRLLTPSGGCYNCPRRRVDFVPATLRRGTVLWLGEAPGATEVERQEGFTGKSGELLRREATAAGVPEPWSFSNAVHCRPPENATPGRQEIECCLSQFVLDEVKDYPIVVMAGSVPLQALFPGAKATHFRGNIAWHPDFPGQRFYAIYHPAYVIRRPDMLDQFRRQMERLGRVARGEGRDSAVIVVTGVEALEAMGVALQAPVVSLDLETTGLASWKPGARILSLGVSADGRSVVAVHENDPHFQATLGLVKQYLQDPAKGVVGNHIAYDVEFLERELDFKARLEGIHDVGLIWYEAKQYQQPSLKQLVAEQLDGYRYLVHEPHLCKDVDLLLRYMAEDVAYSMRLFRRGMEILRPRTRDLVLRVLGPMSLIYQQARSRGLYLRQDYRARKIEEYAERRKQAVAAWQEEDPAFVPKEHETGKGLARYLFDIKGLPVLAVTDKGQKPQVDKAVIKQWIKGGAEYLRHLLTIREIDKLTGTFLTAYDKHLGPDGRIHPSYWLSSTDTSRPSSSDPNVFNIPRGREIRDLFGCPSGSLLLESDLSQIEFRIMVCLAQDETGIEAYLRGDDAHIATARSISGNPNPTKEQRSNAKPVNFANLYGAHWKTAQAQAYNDYGVIWTDAEAQEFQEAFFATYKRMRVFHEACRRKLVQNRGWFESVTGHVHYYADWDSQSAAVRQHAERVVINAEAQGPAANICYYIAVLARRLLDDKGLTGAVFVNSVYDSIMTEVPEPAMVPEITAALDQAAQQAHAWISSWFVVPLVMEHAAGGSWGSLEPVE